MKALIFVSLIILGLDFLAFRGISLLLTEHFSIRTLQIVFWTINLVLYFQMYQLVYNYRTIQVGNPNKLRLWTGIITTIMVSKIGFVLFHVLGDLVWFIQNAIHISTAKSQGLELEVLAKSKFFTQLGAVFALLLLASLTYSITVGRYAFQAIKQKISFDNLPEAFSGLKIVHISDIHLGSFVKDFSKVKVGIDLINAQDPDYIVFTGDLVNLHSDEAEPWVELFAALKAKHGKYSIFGNHDYADYGPFTQEEKNKSIERLKEIHHEMGFKLLEDENLYLEKDGKKIVLAGMHNWGKDFHKIGDINKTLEGVKPEDFTILLSHDPSLWEEEIIGKRKVELTLSGHTHGMQIGIEIPYLNLKWSPVKYRYKRWAGLYEEAKNYIYVNRGFGFLGFPGRVGMKPEITVLELFTKKA